MGEIPRLTDEIAFTKGVEWFSEVVLFYGVLLGIATYEINKSYKGSLATKQRIQDMCEENEAQEKRIAEMRSQVTALTEKKAQLDRKQAEMTKLVDELERAAELKS